MRRVRDGHAQWRDLIAMRLDRPLSRSESRYLNSHLKGCEACRQADHDYREQRAQLRALPQRLPPRDMWARTSAALDREVARGAYRGRGLPSSLKLDFGPRGRRRGPSAALLTTLATVGVVAAVAMMQVMPSTTLTPPTTAARATPFAVDPQQLAFIGNEAADVYLYRTRVGHMCPQNAPECEVADGVFRTAVAMPARLRARNATLDPSGRQLAFVGRAIDRDVIAILVLPEETELHPGNSGGPDGATTPPETPAVASDTPTGEPSSPTVPDTAPPGSPTSTDANPPETTEADSPPPTAPGSTPTAPPESAVPGLRVLAILEDVESAGAPPAWSPSGGSLAFSAMPVDGSHGPDVYVWSPSEERAHAITSDHGSYFASWSGENIVASRALTSLDGSAVVQTVVIDPLTAEERVVDGPRVWLPVVNPARTHALVWLGKLDLSTGLAVPFTGQLYVVDWAALDPFGAGAGGTESGSTDVPAGGPQPSAVPEPLPAELTALDLGRDPVSAPVLDWQVHWSTDGQVLGVWIADSIGSVWGRLTVLAIDPVSGQVDTAQPLLPQTLARRGFSLGMSRVAWVAPSEPNPEGELRIITWGVDGVGGLRRVQPSDLEEVVPAF